MTATEFCTHVNTSNDEYERTAYYVRVIFWSAPIATFSKTHWSKISTSKDMYRAITIRNANTTIKMAKLSGDKKCEHENI
jgi:uncharacterized protein (DUF1697 family)